MVTPQNVTTAVSALLETMDLDPAGQARAAIATALAAKLDDAAGSTSGAVAQSVPGVARELRSAIAELLDGQLDDDELLNGILGRRS